MSAGRNGVTRRGVLGAGSALAAGGVLAACGGGTQSGAGGTKVAAPAAV